MIPPPKAVSEAAITMPRRSSLLRMPTRKPLRLKAMIPMMSVRRKISM